MSKQFNGQLWGGPDHGNLVSATVARIMYRREDWLYLDGDKGNPSVNKVAGAYVWSEERGLFLWEGPGADGDTIERMRVGSEA